MIRLLSVVLLLQVGLIALLYVPEAPDGPARRALMEDRDQNAITAITLTEGNGESLVLTRSGDAWSVDADLPVDGEKLRTLLDALFAQDPGYAVANSAAAAKRFQLAEDNFERRIELQSVDQRETVFLGSSPSFRKIHARRAGEDAVYALRLNSFDIPASAEAWFDRSLLAIADVQELGLYGNTLRRHGGTWLRDDGSAVDGGPATLVQALGGLRVNGIADSSDEALSAATESLRLRVGTASGEVRLSVLANEDEDRYFVQSDRYPQVFTTSAYDAERLTSAVAELQSTAPTDPTSTPSHDRQQTLKGS